MSPSESFNSGQQEDLSEEAPPVIRIYGYPNSPLSGYVEAHIGKEVTPVYLGLGSASCVASFAHTASKYPASCCITLDTPSQLRTDEKIVRKLRDLYNVWLFVDDVAVVEGEVFALPVEYDNPAEDPVYRLKVVSVAAEVERKVRLRRKIDPAGAYSDWQVIFSEKENIWVPFSELWTPQAPAGAEKPKQDSVLVK